MKPVNQTKFRPFGNCTSACVASILECDITDIPYIYKTYTPVKTHYGWIDIINEGLVKFNKRLIWDLEIRDFPSDQHYIAVYDMNPEGRAAHHGVVEYNNEILHCPASFKYKSDYTKCKKKYLVKLIDI